MKNYDTIIIGGGHAGAESAYALARLGHKTLMLTLSLDGIADMACNPNIGGTAKGHLVREIDALGGLMGIIADKATIQTRMLNKGNGPAVHSLRAQVDKALYHRLIKQQLEKTENLTILEAEVIELLFDKNQVKGIVTAMGDRYFAPTVIIATGVFLNAKIIIGEYQKNSGPGGSSASEKFTESLVKCGLPIRRFKTGTPPRLLASSINFDSMEAQCGDIGIPKFSFITADEVRNDYICYLTYTNLDTHKLILDNLHRAPMYNGSISGVGPRYCPSLEDKIVRFKDKERHQVFIEPEGADTTEMYAQGLSTSFPFDIQEKIVHSIKGLENAKITRYGYAIEYDCIDPLALLPTLAVKGYKGLYTAGQINGSSGYEEASAQGLVSAINVHRYLQGKDEVVIKRDQAYIGVLIDDLVTKGTNEPYRMMTSRAEHRLYLRQDNADIRLTELGRKIGLVDDARYKVYKNRLKEIEKLDKLLETTYSPKKIATLCHEKDEQLPKSGVSARDLLKRNNINAEDLIKHLPEFSHASLTELKYLEIETKYQGYLNKQRQAIKESVRMEEKILSPDINYLKIDGLRMEARQKLDKVKPLTLAQASRISGVTPADITVLMLFLRKTH